ncbi:MAG: cation transporter, partial [Calditrichaeota bacterium]
MHALWIFIFSALGIIPLARLIGESTEALARFTGDKLGGLLNATLGNAAELIITIVAIHAGLMELVKASITGSIIGNLLLIMGASLVAGGLRHGVQRFDRANASLAATQMTLAIIALAIPTLFAHTVKMPHPAVENLSLGVAAVMITMYSLSLFFMFSPGVHPPPRAAEKDEAGEKGWSLALAVIMLGICTAAIAYLSEALVTVVEPTIQVLGLSEFFIGII